VPGAVALCASLAKRQCALIVRAETLSRRVSRGLKIRLQECLAKTRPLYRGRCKCFADAEQVPANRWSRPSKCSYGSHGEGADEPVGEAGGFPAVGQMRLSL
jgi:hypothetical protein